MDSFSIIYKDNTRDFAYQKRICSVQAPSIIRGMANMHYKQSTYTVSKKTGEMSYEMDYPPICPFNIEEEKEDVLLIGEKVDWVIWHKGSTIEYINVDGDVTIYYPKPTLREAITWLNDGAYTRFYSDGSVEQRIDGKSSTWEGVGKEGKPFEGKKGWFCEHCNGMIFEDTVLEGVTYHCDKERDYIAYYIDKHEELFERDLWMTSRY